MEMEEKIGDSWGKKMEKFAPSGIFAISKLVLSLRVYAIQVFFSELLSFNCLFGPALKSKPDSE